MHQQDRSLQWNLLGRGGGSGSSSMRASSSLRRPRRLAASALALSARVLACCMMSACPQTIRRQHDTCCILSGHGDLQECDSLKDETRVRDTAGSK